VNNRKMILKMAMATLGESRQGQMPNETHASIHTDALGTRSFDAAIVAMQDTHVVTLKGDVSKD
jgi:hypothetical protein